MNNELEQFREFHWMMDMLQNIDVGLVVLNQDNEIQLWNSFMENHSGLLSSQTRNRDLFKLFPEVEKDWFQNKVQSVFDMKIRAFSIWEQRPFVFKFKNYRPITGIAEHMYQNISIFPMIDTTGTVNNICIIVYDVTDIATNRRALTEANIQLEHLSRTDKLTGLYNRGYWQDCQEREYALFRRYNSKLSLVIFDIDHFKNVNDTFGHQAGDEVIRQCAATLQKNARDTEICGRYGGEEFVAILPETDEKSAMIFAERLRQEIEKLSVVYSGEKISFTVSLGISQLKKGTDSALQWLEQADKALYYSKENGRNKSSVFSHN